MTTTIVILCAVIALALALAWLAGGWNGFVRGREVERRRCIRKLTGHLPGPGPLRETWLRAMLDEV